MQSWTVERPKPPHKWNTPLPARVNPNTGVRIGKRTLYELAAEHSETHQRILIAYCSRKGRAAIYNALVERLDHLLRILGTTDITFAKRAIDGATLGKWKVWFTGRTQRDAISEAELDFIVDIATPT